MVTSVLALKSSVSCQSKTIVIFVFDSISFSRVDTFSILLIINFRSRSKCPINMLFEEVLSGMNLWLGSPKEHMWRMHWMLYFSLLLLPFSGLKKKWRVCWANWVMFGKTPLIWWRFRSRIFQQDLRCMTDITHHSSKIMWFCLKFICLSQWRLRMKFCNKI